MEKHIKEIWKVFKHEKNERFYLFYVENGHLYAERISRDEMNNNGEIDINQLIKIAPRLSGKSIIAVHNHPNDKPTPSYPDFVQKEYLESLLRLMSATMDDYLIVSPYGYVSFHDSGIHNQRSIPPFFADDKIEEVELPNLLLAASIERHQSEIKKALETSTEIIYSPSMKVASNGFKGAFLLDSIDELGSKSVFFCNAGVSEATMERLLDIKIAIEPNEIYLLDNDDLLPLIKNGFL